MKMPFAAALALAATAAFAQFPNKPVTIVVGFEPGGGTDTTARILQGPLGEQIGQQVIVENRAARAAISPWTTWRKRRPTATPSCSRTWGRSR